MKYEKLFTPIQINGVELKNRIVMSPMHDGLGLTGGDVNEQVIEYFAARAKGGVGLIINGFTVVCPDELCGTAGAGQSHLTTLDNRNAFQLLAERRASGGLFQPQPVKCVYVHRNYLPNSLFL